MSRPSLLALLFAVLCALPARAQDAPSDADGKTVAAVAAGGGTPSKNAKIAYDDPAHVHFFRYQRYLIDHKLDGLDKPAWEGLKPAEQSQKVSKTEAFLTQRFGEITRTEFPMHDDLEMLKAVWGPEMAAAAEKLGAARRTKDPDQVAAAEKALAALSAKLGNIKGLNPKKLFDNADGAGDVAGPEEPKVKDFLAADKPNPKFLDALSSPEVTAPLKDAKTFAKFLAEHNVPATALPGLVAMYQTMAKATPAEKKELGHILPTVVKFLQDKHQIVQAEKDEGGTLGMAVPDDYGNPKQVNIYPATAASDPLLVGDTLSHEFQHIYDDYVGRNYTLDSELRGFKTDVLFMTIVKRESPEKYAQMAKSNNDHTRSAIDDTEGLMKAYAAGPEVFQGMVAFGHHYNTWSQGTFEGRMSLREAANPDTGAARQLEGFRQLAASQTAEVAKRKQAYDEASKAHALRPTTATSETLQIAAKDLGNESERLASYRYKVSIYEVQVGALQAEARWLDARSRMSGAADAAKYDLELPVDKTYTEGVPLRGASK